MIQLRLLIPVVMLMLVGGCNAPKVEPAGPPKFEATTPREEALVDLLDMAEGDLDKAMNVKIKLDRERKEIAQERDNANATADLLYEEKQALIDIQKQDANLKRGIVKSLCWFAGLVVLGGVVLGIFMRSLPIGGTVAVGGAVLFFMAFNAGDLWITIITRLAVGGFFALVLFAAAVWIWGRRNGKQVATDEIRMQTDLQAVAKRGYADAAMAAGDIKAAALATAEASVLQHIGTPDYDPTVVGPSPTASSMLAKIAA